MIYEMRTYTIAAGELPTVVKNAGEVAREARVTTSVSSKATGSQRLVIRTSDAFVELRKL